MTNYTLVPNAFPYGGAVAAMAPWLRWRRGCDGTVPTAAAYLRELVDCKQCRRRRESQLHVRDGCLRLRVRAARTAAAVGHSEEIPRDCEEILRDSSSAGGDRAAVADGVIGYSCCCCCCCWRCARWYWLLVVVLVVLLLLLLVVVVVPLQPLLLLEQLQLLLAHLVVKSIR